MGSSVKALAASLRKVAERLRRLSSEPATAVAVEAAGAVWSDLDDDEDFESDEGEATAGEAPDPAKVAAELDRVQDFIHRADSLLRDSKAEKLLDVMRVIEERDPERRVVIFTESLVTQAYLRDLLVERGGFAPEAITLFRGTNDSPRAAEALEHWQHEIGDHLAPGQRPSRSVAVRLALVHEFRTRSRVFISTEAGAKGLNLQFCDTIVNYDLPWNPQRIEQRIGRCHRYGQEHDVTVINFLATDNEAQRLMFEILSRKLDLFGKVLDASDVVLHEPATDAPEKIAGTLGSDFEGRLRRIYERARTVDEIEAELRRLREEMGDERQRFEQTWARTASLIDSRLDERVKKFLRLQADLPAGLARLDHEIDQLLTGYLRAGGIEHRRAEAAGLIRIELPPSPRLPDGWQGGGTVAIGDAKRAEGADPLHLGHPLLQAAVEEARAATSRRFTVSWALDATAPPPLKSRKGARGRLVLTRIRYEGFERVDRLIPIAVLEGDRAPLDPLCGEWLLEHAPRDRQPFDPALAMEDAVEDAIAELVFADQASVAGDEQPHFERSLEQIERYMDDQVLVLRRRLTAANESLNAAEEQRNAALGADARGQAEERLRRIAGEIEGLEAQIRRLEDRQDPEYERWREHAHRRRYRAPETTRILDVEFILK